MSYSAHVSAGVLFLVLTGSAIAQDGTAHREHLGDALDDDGDGIPRYREDTGWSSANYDQPRWGVYYGTEQRSSPWASVLQSDRTNASFIAGANQLVLDLAGHTYTIEPFLDKGIVEGGVMIVSDRLDTGASLTIANGTFRHKVTTWQTLQVGEPNTTGRLTLENATYIASQLRAGMFPGSSGYITLKDGGKLQVNRELNIGTTGDASIELRGAGSELSAGWARISRANGLGTIVLRNPTATFRVLSGALPGNLEISNRSSAGLTPGLRVDAGTVEIDGDVKLGLWKSSGSGVIVINGGSVAVGGVIEMEEPDSQNVGGKIFLHGGRLEVAGPTAFAPIEEEQFYWDAGTLAFSEADTVLTDVQLGNYTRQGAISYEGDRAAGSLAGGQVLESAGKLTLSGGTFGLNGGTIRSATGLVVNAPLAGHGMLDAVVSGTGTITNATTGTLSIGALAGSNAIDSTGELRVGSRNVDATFTGSASGTGTFVKVGSRTQTIAGQVFNTGGVTVEQGALVFDGSGQRLSTTAVDLADGTAASFINGATGTASSVTVGSTTASSDAARLEIIGPESSLAVTGGMTNRGWIEIDAGTLSVDGSLVNHGTLVNDGTLVATVSGQGTLTGTGEFAGAVAISNGAALAPGQSPGQMNFTDLTLGAGGRFDLEIAAAVGTAGEQWDLAVISNALTVAATVADPFHVVLTSLDGSLQPGALNGFDPAEAFSWQFIAATIANPDEFALESLQLDTTDFVLHNDLEGGSLSLAAASDGLYVSFAPQVAAVPEPGSALLLALAGATGGLWRVRRKSTKSRANSAKGLKLPPMND